MYDSENRLEGARYFLTCARKNDINDPRIRWYIQAAASFAIAASEVLAYDHARKTGLDVENLTTNLLGLKDRFKDDKFFGWLCGRLELDLEESKKSIDGTRYAFLRRERNRILHRGEPDKNVKIDISASPISIFLYFEDWGSESCDVACERTIRFVESIISDAKSSCYL
ncbi:MAG: hypothetical protein ABSF09_14325 [Candidatus Bathyarchaeia archaeon]|jgi:hypothetical protein